MKKLFRAMSKEEAGGAGSVGGGSVKTELEKLEQESDKSPRRGLAAELALWRANRPGEWKMDEFIRMARQQETELEKLEQELRVLAAMVAMMIEGVEKKIKEDG